MYFSLNQDHPRYAFNYAVNDPHTHDKKSQWETRDGDIVKGSYSLVEPDGSLRVVDYYADDHRGFNAIVKKLGPNIHSHGPILHGISAAPLAPLVPLAPLLPLAPVSDVIAKIPLRADVTNVILPPTSSLKYGFGPGPLPLGLPKVTSLGPLSLPWDPHTHSYGGWVPLHAPLPISLPYGPYATLVTKKYDSKGRLLHIKQSLPIHIGSGKTIVVKKH